MSTLSYENHKYVIWNFEGWQEMFLALQGLRNIRTVAATTHVTHRSPSLLIRLT